MSSGQHILDSKSQNKTLILAQHFLLTLRVRRKRCLSTGIFNWGVPRSSFITYFESKYTCKDALCVSTVLSQIRWIFVRHLNASSLCAEVNENMPGMPVLLLEYFLASGSHCYIVCRISSRLIVQHIIVAIEWVNTGLGQVSFPGVHLTWTSYLLMKNMKMAKSLWRS